MKRLLLILLALPAVLPAGAQGVRKTMDEFNKMSRSDTSLVVLHGVVSRLKGDQRGVFYLKDETGEAYVYGLVDGRPGMNVSFPQMEVVIGDTLTVSGRRTVYPGDVQGKGSGCLLSLGPIPPEIPERGLGSSSGRDRPREIRGRPQRRSPGSRGPAERFARLGQRGGAGYHEFAQMETGPEGRQACPLHPPHPGRVLPA